MQQKSINLAATTHYSSQTPYFNSTANYQQYNQPIYHNSALNSLQPPHNYVQIPRGNVMGSVNQPIMSNSYALPLNNYPIYLKSAQSQYVPPHAPPSYLVRAEPIIRRHPQYDLNMNFDYEEANFLCESKITEEDIYCVVCNVKYVASEKQKHLQKHIRKSNGSDNQEAFRKIRQYKSREQKAPAYKLKPIVQPEECFVPFQPNTFKIIQKTIYEDHHAPQMIQKSLGHEQQIQSSNPQPKDYRINLQAEPNLFLSNYHNTCQQHQYNTDNQMRPDEPFIYPEHQPKILQHAEPALPILPETIHLEPLEQAHATRVATNNANQLQRRSLVGSGVPMENQGERIMVQPENYSQLNNANKNENYNLKRSLAPGVPINNQPVGSNVPYPGDQRTSLNQKQPMSPKRFEPEYPNHYHPQSQADSFSAAHEIHSSKKDLSKKDSSAYQSQFLGQHTSQGEGIKERKKSPYRSQW